MTAFCNILCYLRFSITTILHRINKFKWNLKISLKQVDLKTFKDNQSSIRALWASSLAIPRPTFVEMSRHNSA